jgi:hypothetical protein
MDSFLTHTGLLRTDTDVFQAASAFSPIAPTIFEIRAAFFVIPYRSILDPTGSISDPCR